MRSSIDTSPSGTLNKKQFSLTGKLKCEAMASGRCRAPRWLKQPPGRGAYLVDWSRAAHAAPSYQQDSRAQPQALLLLGSGPLVARQMALAGREASENITGSARWSPITGSVQWRGREGRQPQQDAVDVKEDPGADVTKTRPQGNADDGAKKSPLGSYQDIEVAAQCSINPYPCPKKGGVVCSLRPSSDYGRFCLAASLKYSRTLC
ncbi:hypothetical protein HPB50_028308 [Hyalomma asiaticum]|nr:hypothetical protein HPB50_028308 [Hyalomma asiaticum]